MQRSARAARLVAALAISATMIAGTAAAAAQPVENETGPDITTLDLDRYGADFVRSDESAPARGIDTSTLFLDSNGADVATASWWDLGSFASVDARRGPDISVLNLDRDGADVVD